MTPVDALGLIIRRCPNLAAEASKGLRSSVPYLRMQMILPAALGHDVWTADERTGLINAAAGAEDSGRKSRQINVRLSPAEYDTLAQRSQDAGVSMSDYLRSTI